MERGGRRGRGMEGGGRDGEGLRDGVEGGERWGGGNLATRLGKVHDQVLGHSDVCLLVLSHTTVGVIIQTHVGGVRYLQGDRMWGFQIKRSSKSS